MTLPMTRDEAWGLFCEWTPSESLRRHVLAVEACMRAYARKFGSKPDDLPEPQRTAAMAWLSRGLDEALLAFIGQGAGPAVGPFPEFRWSSTTLIRTANPTRTPTQRSRDDPGERGGTGVTYSWPLPGSIG